MTVPEVKPPRRVVSLVPSLTESLFDLGFGDTIASITDYCIYPENETAGLPRVGGPKNPNIEQIAALQPDLIFANREENTPQTVQQLEQAGLKVRLSFPQDVAQALDVLWELASLYGERGGPGSTAHMLIKTLSSAAEAQLAAAMDAPRLRFFCPIWQDRLASGERWWMTFNRSTYAHSVLELVGGENVFAARERLYPLEADLGLRPPDPAASQGRDTRYPRVTQEEILSAKPEVILLPSEPYDYNEQHLDELRGLFASTPAVQAGRIYRIDGSLITWHGTRLGLALEQLPRFFLSVSPA
jgi:iron complex transport system substrate-binding protein